MVRSNLRLLAYAATIAAITCPSTHAQTEDEVESAGHALLVGASYGSPLRQTFSAGWFFTPDELGSIAGTTVGGSVGTNGMRVWGGRKVFDYGGGDWRAVLTRTWDHPRGGASPHSTYVGAEVGLGGLRLLSVGYARRIAGPSTGRNHLFTLSVGIEFPILYQSHERLQPPRSTVPPAPPPVAATPLPQDPDKPPDTRVRGYWVDPSSGLMWAAKDNFSRDLTWRKAARYCGDLQLAGFADWRLPTIRELEGIYDRSASAQGLSGPHNNTPISFHVKGDLFLTGDAWSATWRPDERGRPGGFALLFDFVNAKRQISEMYFFTGDRALCVRGEVTVDLSLPGLSRYEAARRAGVDYEMALQDIGNNVVRHDYWGARRGCEDGVVTGRGAERNCRKWVDLTDRLEGVPPLDRVYALGLLGIDRAAEARWAEALPLLERALATRRERYEDDADAADFQVILAQVQIMTGNAAAAAALVKSAIATYETEIERPSALQERYRRRLAAIRKRYGGFEESVIEIVPHRGTE